MTRNNTLPSFAGTTVSKCRSLPMSTPSQRRLGFPVKIFTRPDLKSNDTRRWQQNPHLKVSLQYIDAILDHLTAKKIDMYRMASDLAPYATHPDLPQFRNMVAESDAELRAIGTKAKAMGIRLSFHPSQYIVLNSPDPDLVRRSTADLLSQAEILDRMELGPESVMVIHVGGTYGDRQSANARWVETWKTLPEPVRRRLVLEHDDVRFSASDILWIHQHSGVRLIFDHQHFWCLNPENMPMMDTVRAILRTWPDGQRPKIHFSSPRTEPREVKRKVTASTSRLGSSDQKSKRRPKTTTVQIAPVWTGHADYIHPFEFLSFMREAKDLDFDVMLEAKVKDMALIRLRVDMLRYAPEVAAQFGLTEQEKKVFEDENKALEETEVVEIDESYWKSAAPSLSIESVPSSIVVDIYVDQLIRLISKGSIYPARVLISGTSPNLVAAALICRSAVGTKSSTLLRQVSTSSASSHAFSTNRQASAIP
jgi:UV DNA damage endonuclease